MQVDHNFKQKRFTWHSASSLRRKKNKRSLGCFIEIISVKMIVQKRIQPNSIQSVRQGDTWSGLHGIPGIQRKQDERSHPSSEDTPLYLEDLPNSDPAAEYEASDSTEAGRGGMRALDQN